MERMSTVRPFVDDYDEDIITQGFVIGRRGINFDYN